MVSERLDDIEPLHMTIGHSTPVNLRGGMVSDESRSSSLLSGDVQEGSPETDTAAHSSSVCSDNVPSLIPIPSTVNGQTMLPALMRRVTPITFVDRTETGTVLVSEPTHLHLPRSVVQEDIERARGTIATTTTPVLGPVRSLQEGDPDLAGYVDHRFGLDGVGNHTDAANQLEDPVVTFNVPNYGHAAGALDIREPIGQTTTETTLGHFSPRRISDALQNARSRIMDFFPTTDVVTSRKTSVAASASRRSRFSVSLQRALGEQNLISRAANMITPSTSYEPPSTRPSSSPLDGASSPHEEDTALITEDTQQPAHVQVFPTRIAKSAGTGVLNRRASEPIMSQTNRDALAQSNISPRRNFSSTGRQAKNDAVSLDETKEHTDSPTWLQRAWQRLSTTLASSTRLGSYDGASAPPPTRDERYSPEDDHRTDNDPNASQPNSQSRASKFGRRLRHFGSSTLKFTRRRSLRSSAPLGVSAPSPDGEAEYSSTGYGQSKSSIPGFRTTPVNISDTRGHTQNLDFPSGGSSLFPNAVTSEVPRTLTEKETKQAGAVDSRSSGEVRRRHLLPSDWRGSIGRVAARFQRHPAPSGSGYPQQTGDETSHTHDNRSERAFADETTDAGVNAPSQGKIRSPLGESLDIPGRAARDGSNPRPPSRGNLKSMLSGVREFSRSEQNVIPL